MGFPSLILASGSPRRSQLLRLIVPRFEAIPADIEETSSYADPHKRLVDIATQKARVVGEQRDGVIVAADTAVLLDGQLLGKPADPDTAAHMLRRMSGRAHQAITGLCVTNTLTGHTATEVVTTQVHFKTIDEALLRWYLDSGDYADKAGAYGIQGHGALLVERLEGDYYNVMGLPLGHLADLLEAVGYDWKQRIQGQ